MESLSPSTTKDDSDPVVLAELVEIEELADLLDDEQDELTIRRVFEPKRPARVAVEISDADKTWKWERPRADAQGQFVGLALPVLDEGRALEFDPSEVEVTSEMMSPFALTSDASRPAAILLAAARRRPRPMTTVRPQKKQPSFVRSHARSALIIAAAMLAAFALAFYLGRGSQRFNIGVSAGVGELVTSVDLPPISDVPLHGTIVPSVKGHRLYVDGKLLGDSDGPVTVDCGTRLVRLGSSGAAKSVAVPCGGEVTISP